MLCIFSSLSAWAGHLTSATLARRSRSTLAVMLLALTCGVLVLAGWAKTAWMDALQRPVAFLVLGSDNRKLDGPSRSDAIFVLRTDPSAGIIRGLSIPRDLYVPLTGLPLNRKSDRINTAMFWGEYYTPHEGLNAACQTISDLIHVPVKGGIVVRFELIRKMVDALGGVEVYLDQPVCDRSFNALGGGYSYVLRFESGWNYLNGDRALEFIRVRKPDTDFGRMNRNRQLLNTLMGQLRNTQSIFKIALHLPSLWKEIDNNLSFMDKARVAWTCYRLRDRSIAWYSIQRHEVSNTMTPRGAQVLVPDQGVLSDAGRKLMGEPQHLALAH